ncbi:MAG: ribonuclease Y [bacterium]
MDIISLLIFGIPIAAGLGYGARIVIGRRQIKSLESKAKKLIDNAKVTEKEIVLEAKDEAIKIKREAGQNIEKKERDLREIETGIRKRQTLLDERSKTLDDKSEAIQTKIKEVELLKKDLGDLKGQQLKVLEKISKISKEDARKTLFDLVEKENRDELAHTIKKVEIEAKEHADKKASEIIATVIQRLSSETTRDLTVSAVAIPNEEMKGRIIGKEGRNVQSFEKMTGVELIIDDTPNAVTVSCFDPVRREVAKITLERLIKDGRIHPARIEEIHKKVIEDINKDMKDAAEKALYEAGIIGIHSDLVKIVGRLKYRTSYGQNILKHAVECSKIAQMLAEELGADVELCKRGAFFHDIGKALDQTLGGDHVQVGRDIAKKYGLDPRVVHSIEAHHEGVPAERIEDYIVAAADAISGSRPGARRESTEQYIQRLRDLENIANSFEGIEKSYAIQAGREIRIFVKPDEVDDLGATKLSHNIARKIESELKFPGEIKVHIIRETRAVDWAK